MSFNFGPMQNLSNVQASSKSTPGGGGNTGYFKRGKKDEENASFGFSKDYPEDSFESEGSLEEIQNQSFIDIIKNLFLDFIEAIKNLFIKKEDDIEE